MHEASRDPCHSPGIYRMGLYAGEPRQNFGQCSLIGITTISVRLLECTRGTEPDRGGGRVHNVVYVY